MNKNWVTWDIDRDTDELVSECCQMRLPNTFEGLMEAREHECADEIRG